MQTIIAQLRRIILIFSFVFSLVVALPEASMAADDFTADNNPLAKALCRAVIFITGTYGKAIATAAIIAVGIGALLGKMQWGAVILVVTGIVIVFAAPMVVMYLSSMGDSSFCNFAKS
ncbi:MAG: TrbC/VirB2 family protein [Sphingobacteriia bacterium]|nr:TrbC/VirB2 family protein [Sphingobacteriia bacterium]